MKIKDKIGNDFELKSCRIKTVPDGYWTNPENLFEREQLSVFTPNYWGPGGVTLTVGFLDNPSSELKDKILLHMNAWNKTANVKFIEAQIDPIVRITRSQGFGNWSYLGTYIERIPPDRPTMNLDSFTINTPDSEFYRVVRHEAGHTLGFPHEHMRREIIKRIDIDKAIQYYQATEGWTVDKIYENVLTPLEDISIMGTNNAEVDSIMCYPLPGSITIDGNPIIGGYDISEQDYEFAGKIYPK